MKIRSVRSLGVHEKRVFVRVDFNVPLAEDGGIRTDARIRAALPTINLLLDRGATVVLASHLGKPKGRVNPKLGLKPIAEHLGRLLARKVTFAPNCVGPETERLVAAAPSGSVILLENLRFHAGEEANNPAFASALAALADEYVNDAFGTAHRAHASTAGIAEEFERPAAGLLMEKEVESLARVMEAPEPPFVAVIGGSKVSDKAGVIANILPRVTSLLTGGGVVFTFLKAKGREIGTSLCEPDFLDTASKLLSNPKLVLPADVIVAIGPDEPATARVVPEDGIPPAGMGLDIGPAAARLYAEAIAKARTVIWAGPMGVFEKDAFAAGSEAVARGKSVLFEDAHR
ncbi:MAG TPA: phosphoglycerate kinase, partial [candidate division WOR-3 bacterium]|nr:phosphoglycerate kinase [candidate division WOR-3 bacterium]